MILCVHICLYIRVHIKVLRYLVVAHMLHTHTHTCLYSRTHVLTMYLASKPCPWCTRETCTLAQIMLHTHAQTHKHTHAHRVLDFHYVSLLRTHSATDWRGVCGGNGKCLGTVDSDLHVCKYVCYVFYVCMYGCLYIYVYIYIYITFIT
jgi:hypothetical protein